MKDRRPLSSSVRIVLLPLALVLLLSCSSPQEKEANQCMVRAYKAYDKKEYRVTVDAVTRALELTDGGKPTSLHGFNIDGEWTMWRARAYMQLGEYQQAIADYSRSINLIPAYLMSTQVVTTPRLYFKEDRMRELSQYFEDRALAYEATKDFELAAEDYVKGMALLDKGLNVPSALLSAEEQQLWRLTGERFKSSLEKVRSGVVKERKPPFEFQWKLGRIIPGLL